MKRFLRSEAGSIILWFAGAILLAAVMVPFLYRAGMGFGEYAAAHELPGVLEWLGKSCRRADLGRYFSRALTNSALLLLPRMIRRIRRIRSAAGGAAVSCASVSWKSAGWQVLTGFVIAAGLLWGMGLVLEMLGAFVAKGDHLHGGKVLAKIVVPGLVVPPLEEWLFRGVLLGLWLGFARPLSACVWTSLVFSFVHFLRLPDGVKIADPAAVTAGFEMLGKVLAHIANPLFFVTDFATLFAIGMILAWSRVRTRALWFPIGLHAGWIMAFKGFNLFYADVPEHPLRPWGVGDSLRSGVFPLLTLVLTAVICHYALKRFDRPRGFR